MPNKVKPNFIVRELQLSDCEDVRKLWSEFEFIFSKYLNEVMLNVDPKGLFVAQDMESGKILGVCSSINLTPDLAFIGQYIVKSEYQGMGIGPELWQKTIDHIGTERNVGLLSRLSMSTKYRDRCGFDKIAKHKLAIFIGKPNLDKLIDSIDGISLQSINEDNIESVVKYDKTVCDGIDRTALLRQIPKLPETVNLVAINQKQQILGYCVVKTTNTNIGNVEPLYADNEKIAELLVNKCCQLLSSTTDNGLVFVCWPNNHKAIGIANKLNLIISRESQIQFSKKLVFGNLDKIYSVSSRNFYPF